MKPNIVMIIVDALRPKDLSLYGHPKEVDKNIKKISSESVVFNKNFAASNASDTSLTAIFSGQYPTTSGFVHQFPRLEKEEIDKLRKNKFWLPVYLRERGYDTIATTPTHLWFKKGFNYSTEKKAKGRGSYFNIPFIKKILLKLPNTLYKLGKKIIKSRASPEFYSAKEIIDLSISKIEENRKKQKPFFLFMHLADTHTPYAAVETKVVKSKKTIKEILKNIKSPSQKEYIKKRFYDCSVNSLEQLKLKVDDSIIFVDEQIGELSNFLKKNNLWKNTIFIIFSDHGENLGEHNNYLCRGGLYDDSIHVPLIIHFPGIKADRINEITSSIDIAPTILDFLGEEKKNIDGKSLIPLIKKREKIRNKIISVDGFCKNRIAVRTKSKKMILSENGKCYLCGDLHGEKKEEYDLEKDPEEVHNIYKKENEFEKYLNKIGKNMGYVPK